MRQLPRKDLAWQVAGKVDRLGAWPGMLKMRAFMLLGQQGRWHRPGGKSMERVVSPPLLENQGPGGESSSGSNSRHFRTFAPSALNVPVSPVPVSPVQFVYR